MGETAACCLCGIYRPDREPRLPDYPPVCDGDRHLLDRYLIEIANLHADLVNDEPSIVDRRRHERFGIEWLPKGGGRRIVSLGEVWSDPLAAVNGVSPIPSRSKQPTVSGSREKPLPISADRHDLKAPARQPNPSQAARDWPEDQIGRQSAATILDQWVRDTRDILFPGHHLPPATVDELVGWLRMRLDTICDRHHAVDEFAAEIRDLRGALRGATGATEPQPEHCGGIPCKRCQLLTLFRDPGGDVTCIDPNCQAVLRDDEYREWVKTLFAEEKIRRRSATREQQLAETGTHPDN
jgi:hypothetical protein